MAKLPRVQPRRRESGVFRQVWATLSHRPEPGSPARLWRAAALACLCLVLGTGAVRAAPTIQSLSSDQGALGSYVTLYGTDFGASQGQSYVLLANRFVPAVAWSDVAITILLYPQVTDAPLALDSTYPLVVVKRPGDQRSNEFPFSLIYGLPSINRTTGEPRPEVPDITSARLVPVDDSDTPAGYRLILQGEGFGDVQGQGGVLVYLLVLDDSGLRFVTLLVPILDWTDNYITAFLSPPDGLWVVYHITVVRGDNFAFGDLDVDL